MKKLVSLLIAVSTLAGCPVSALAAKAESSEDAKPKASYTYAVKVGRRDPKAKTYKNGSPRFNDKNAIKDIEMSETRKYVFTDDKGENGCGTGEVIHYATIPVGDDMPSRIALIDIDTDRHIGYMYDNGKTATNGDEKANDGIYSIRLRYDLDIDSDPDKSESYSRCYFALYTDAHGKVHTPKSLTYVNVQEKTAQKELSVWDEVNARINAVMTSDEYNAASTDEKEKMLLDELALLADEGLVYRDLTRTNKTPRSVVYKIVNGPTVIVSLAPCSCGYGYDDKTCDSIDSMFKKLG